jgi:hypothetical protein
MNRPVLHRAIYLHEIERAQLLDAALQVDALLDRVCQPEPANFCADVEHEPAVSPWLFWPVVVAFSLVLSFAAYELAHLAVAIGSVP